ncbi:MAG: GNAT family N-acetyltransferase [bacterium]|nr:GNAT family N-acetyltransferase [bacterium]
MQKSLPMNVVIRDGLASDIQACLNLDHSYANDRAWQMTVYKDEDGYDYRITLKIERFPRVVEVMYPSERARLEQAAAPEHCFLVAVQRETDQLVGYLVMTHDRVRHLGQVDDIVVDRPARRREIGTRLLNVARVWAREQHIQRLTLCTQSTNYPAINFCQHAGFTFSGFNDRLLAHYEIAVFFSQSMR